MVPSAFVFLEKLPLSPNGKVDRRALPAPERRRVDPGRAFLAPRTATEQTVAAIWAEVLHVEQIGVCDNFFEMGGHSLLAVQVVSRLGAAFEVELPLRSFFEKPTVAELAGHLEALRWARQAQEKSGQKPAAHVVRGEL
jgi:acyl carrier protein